MLVALGNRKLQAEDDTLALFKRIFKQDAELARQCYPIAEDLLVRSGEYQLCITLIPDSQARLNSIRQEFDRSPKVTGLPPELEGTMRKHAEKCFVTRARDLIEILVGNGRKAEAERIRTEALSILQDPSLSSAVVDAEQSVARVRGPKAP